MTATPEEVSSKTFDFVVIGGGTAGLTVAARLAEDPEVSVVVLEAGQANLDDPLINIPAQFGKHFGDPNYDWNLRTEPQKHADNQSYHWARGKTLGGSSAINFYAWSKPPKQDIDAWEKLGNPGWNWSNYSRYATKVERFTPPNAEKARLYKQTFNPDAHGTSGPLDICFPGLITGGELSFQETMVNAGVGIAKDPLNGDTIGCALYTCTLNPRAHTRTSAVTAFYLPNKDKANFRVLCGALVHRLVLEAALEDDDVRATGVEFEVDGRIYIAHAKKDVILSAGALKSPQILELSGIGDRMVLDPLGIRTVIDLPGVGTNLQEHLCCPIVFDRRLELNPALGYDSLDALRDERNAAVQFNLHAKGEGLHRLGITCYSYMPLSFVTLSPQDAQLLIDTQKQKVEHLINTESLPPGLKEQYDIQLQKLVAGKGADCEIMCFPGCLSGYVPEEGKRYISLFPAINHPFSRGTIHIKSGDPHEQPVVNPHYFEEELDLQIFSETAKYARRLSAIEPFKNTIIKEVAPGPDCISEDDIRKYIKRTMSTVFHTIGTLSMSPKARNGVVDSQLLVYGTKNIRVVDLSIAPLQIAAHSQATAYAIGEQAADIIKAIHKAS